MVVILGSSTANCRAKWLRAAFEAPYAPHVEYAPVETPEEVKITPPLLLRNAGTAALACLCQAEVDLWHLSAHECNSAEEVDVKKLLPVSYIATFDFRYGIQHAMIDNQTIQRFELLNGAVYRFLCERGIRYVPSKHQDLVRILYP